MNASMCDWCKTSAPSGERFTRSLYSPLPTGWFTLQIHKHENRNSDPDCVAFGDFCSLSCASNFVMQKRLDQVSAEAVDV